MFAYRQTDEQTDLQHNNPGHSVQAHYNKMQEHILKSALIIILFNKKSKQKQQQQQRILFKT